MSQSLHMAVERETDPIGERYADIAMSFLEPLQDQPITPVMIEYLGNLLATHNVELAGVAEASKVLKVSKQRLYQLEGRMPEPALRLRATPIWVVEDLETFDRERKDHFDTSH